jgi:hypothetical protein
MPHDLLPFTLRLDAWANRGSPYLERHIRSAAASVAMVLSVALIVAYGLFRFRTRGKPEGFRPNGDIWLYGLADPPDGKVPYVGVHLADGRLIEGKLHAFTFDIENGRGLVVGKPIRITEKGEIGAHDLANLDRLIIEAAQVSFISVIHVPSVPPARPQTRLTGIMGRCAQILGRNPS